MTRQEIDALAEEIARYCEPVPGVAICKMCSEDWPCTATRAAKALRALAAERDTLAEDKARLDWLEVAALRGKDDETQESLFDLSIVPMDEHVKAVWAVSLRAAIDAARHPEAAR